MLQTIFQTNYTHPLYNIKRTGVLDSKLVPRMKILHSKLLSKNTSTKGTVFNNRTIPLSVYSTLRTIAINFSCYTVLTEKQQPPRSYSTFNNRAWSKGNFFKTLEFTEFGVQTNSFCCKSWNYSIHETKHLLKSKQRHVSQLKLSSLIVHFLEIMMPRHIPGQLKPQCLLVRCSLDVWRSFQACRLCGSLFCISSPCRTSSPTASEPTEYKNKHLEHWKAPVGTFELSKKSDETKLWFSHP